MTTNDTRTAQERAEELAAKTYPISDNQRVTYQRMQTHLREAFRHGFLARDAEPTTVTAEELDAEFLKAREEIHAVSQFQPASYLVHVNDANTVIDRLQKRVMNRFRIEGDEA